LTPVFIAATVACVSLRVWHAKLACSMLNACCRRLSDCCSYLWSKLMWLQQWMKCKRRHLHYSPMEKGQRKG
jgi:hypothetical protein